MDFLLYTSLFATKAASKNTIKKKLWSYLAPFLRYGELLAENCDFSLTHSHLTPSLRVKSFEFLDEFFIPKTRVLGLSVDEDFVILACVVFTQWQRVTDGQTDEQTDIPTMASTGLA